MAARVLADPSARWRQHFNESIERIYRTNRASIRDGLAEAFLAAEAAYVRHSPGFCGTISLEPLLSSQPGPPVYLAQRITPEARRACGTDLKRVRGQFEKLMAGVPENGSTRMILRCIDNVRRDLSA
ncbi:MAG TPA: hypothetical protein VFB63_08940 [Bryobacteraceae bacterium]|nr:hypothetical protein [Bryobacteraceae bacterium]